MLGPSNVGLYQKYLADKAEAAAAAWNGEFAKQLGPLSQADSDFQHMLRQARQSTAQMMARNISY